jgi:adenylyltransferase/sulfurtransferase
MNEITVQELKQMREAGTPHQLIDVREIFEYDEVNIKGESIPMALVPLNLDRIRRDVPVVIQCKSGGRSGQITQFLHQRGYDNVVNLRGGILAWIDQIDPSLNKP